MIFKYFFQVNLVGISKDKQYYFMTIFHFTFFFFNGSVTSFPQDKTFKISYLNSKLQKCLKTNFFHDLLEVKSDKNWHKTISGLYPTLMWIWIYFAANILVYLIMLLWFYFSKPTECVTEYTVYAHMTFQKWENPEFQ